jgi:hypothetical protein
MLLLRLLYPVLLEVLQASNPNLRPQRPRYNSSRNSGAGLVTIATMIVMLNTSEIHLMMMIDTGESSS